MLSALSPQWDLLSCLLEWRNYSHSKKQMSCKRQPFESNDNYRFINFTTLGEQFQSPYMSEHINTLLYPKAKRVFFSRRKGTETVVTFSDLSQRLYKFHWNSENCVTFSVKSLQTSHFQLFFYVQTFLENEYLLGNDFAFARVFFFFFQKPTKLN